MVSAAGNVAVAAEIPDLSLLVELHQYIMEMSFLLLLLFKGHVCPPCPVLSSASSHHVHKCLWSSRPPHQLLSLNNILKNAYNSLLNQPGA